MNDTFIGIDGCKGGWVAARLYNGQLTIVFYDTISKLIKLNPDADEYLIDMAIGLPRGEKHIRPETAAREILKKRSVTVFSVPCRQVVELGDSKSKVDQLRDELKKINRDTLGRSLSQQTLAIIPKIAELDKFLQERPEYKNRLCESHPEVCFARLNGEVLESKKSRKPGIEERKRVLERFLEPGALDDLAALAKDSNCKKDDVLDAVCLAVTARFKAERKCECIQGEVPLGDERFLVDDTGLKMQMVVPVEDVAEEVDGIHF